MGKWDNRTEGKHISSCVIKEKPTDQLLEAKKFISDLLTLRKSKKLYTTYVTGIKKALAYNDNNRVYVSFNIDGTITGRLSCTGYEAAERMGPSFHTLPRDEEGTDEKAKSIRKLFSAEEGYFFVTSDYAAMELRILAHIADEKTMQKAFIDDLDLHTYTAQLLFKKKDISKKERQIAKTVSFLIVYGGGAFNLSESQNISMHAAETILTNYQKVFPGIFAYMDTVREEIEATGHVTTIFGRRRNLPDIYAKDIKVRERAFRQGLNTTIQSPASDVMTASMVSIQRRFRAENIDARVLATVHDSVENRARKAQLAQALEIIYDEQVNYNLIKKVFNLNFKVPLKIEMEVGSSFAGGQEIHFKNGKPILEGAFAC